MIINRYIFLEIIKPMATVLAILVALFAAYSTMHYLEDAVYGLMPASTVIKLILFKILIALEVLLPSTLYFSVIVGIGRLYKDGEITAMLASGINVTRIFAVVFFLSLSVAFIVASLSLFVRPWAYKQRYSVKEKAKDSFDVTRLKAGRFYNIGGKDRFIFLQRVDQKLKKAEGVFIQQNTKNENDALEVIYAKNALQRLNRSSDTQDILFSDGWIHKFSRTGKGKWEVTKFDQLAFTIWPKEIASMEYKRKAASSFHLADSNESPDIAELQWRFSTSLSTILLALLGIPISRTTPRKGKYGNVAVAMLIYTFYYGLSTLAKILVTQGTIPTLPGIWWVQILLAIMLYTLLFHPFKQFRRRLRRF